MTTKIMMWKARESDQKVRRPFTSFCIEITVLILGVTLAFGIWLLHAIWYEDTIPVAPVPEGARLLQRNPELAENQYPYHSAIARYWYYEKYSTTMTYDEVKTFYQGKNAAWPFGGFSVTVLPPVTKPVTMPYNKARSEFLGLPFERNKEDSMNETLILLEVSKTPSDYGPGVFVFCLFPITLIFGLVIVIARYQKAARGYNSAIVPGGS
ncbi:MAG: hypothetical protein AAGF95_25935 [Chloroflexota bacterium]